MIEFNICIQATFLFSSKKYPPHLKLFSAIFEGLEGPCFHKSWQLKMKQNRQCLAKLSEKYCKKNVHSLAKTRRKQNDGISSEPNKTEYATDFRYLNSRSPLSLWNKAVPPKTLFASSDPKSGTWTTKSNRVIITIYS